MKQRSIQAIADYLAHRPIGRIVTVLPVGKDDYIISIEDRRDGREHVLETADDLELWLESFKQRRLLQPTKLSATAVARSTATATSMASSSSCA